MIIAGIDAGIENTKVIVMKDGEVVGRAKAATGGIGRAENAKRAYTEALSAAGLNEDGVTSVIVTGKGKFDIPFASVRITETIAAAYAARFLVPGATAVVSAGADETLAAVLGEERLIGEFVLNQKCAAGLGTFLTYLAQRLGISLESVSPDTKDAGALNEGCVVFSELDALSLINAGAEPKEVLMSAVKAVAVRAATVVNDLTLPLNERVVLIGGLAQNTAFVYAIEEVVGFKFTVPDDAEYCGAIGAAISGGKVS